MEKKISSYQKMKCKYESEIKKLKKDITILIKDDGCHEQQTLKILYRMKIEKERLFLKSKKSIYI